MNKQIDAARSELLAHARKVSREHELEVAGWPGIVKHGLGKSHHCLPGYIPLIGKQYFAARTKIITYALSQNIRADSGWALEWAKDWHRSTGHIALDRQNLYYSEYGSAAMRPFDTGHLPILAAFARWLTHPQKESKRRSIYEEIAATNLSKYSFRSPSDMTCDSDFSLRRCFDWFSANEFQVLAPDIVICAGSLVAGILTTALHGKPIKVLHVPFPSTLVINTKYRNKFFPTPEQVATLQSMLSREDLNRTVGAKERKLSEVIKKDAAFFWQVFESMQAQLKGQTA